MAGGSIAWVVVARARLAGALLLVAVASSGCPNGAELENPERYRQYPLATGGAAMVQSAFAKPIAIVEAALGGQATAPADAR